MATIGTFKKDGAGYSGSIETLTLRANITFERDRRHRDRRKPRELLLPGVEGCPAAWLLIR